MTALLCTQVMFYNKRVKFLVVTLLISFFFISKVNAEPARTGYSYRLANGKLDTTSGESIPNGTSIVIEGSDSWSVSYRVLDEVGQPTGPVYVSSKQWVELTIRPLTIDDIVKGLIGQSPTLMKEPQNPTEVCIPNDVELPNQKEVQEETQTSSLGDFKSLENLDQYFACYKKNDDLNFAYLSSYKETLAMVSDHYEAHSADDKTREDTSALMSCLIFRESHHWDEKTSDTGAVGLGQFTSVAIDQVKKILSYRGKDNFDERVKTQEYEFSAGRLTEDELKENLSMIESERRNYERMTELQRLWTSYPLRNRPGPEQINSKFLGNNHNHQAVIALSSLLLRECELRFKQDEIKMDPKMSLFACAGAYNIGYGGFLDNAIERNGEQSLDSWINNLKQSGHRQSRETTNHLISIKRCIDKEENYAPCGTEGHYCKGLPKTNACTDNIRPLCSEECS